MSSIHLDFNIDSKITISLIYLTSNKMETTSWLHVHLLGIYVHAYSPRIHATLKGLQLP